MHKSWRSFLGVLLVAAGLVVAQPVAAAGAADYEPAPPSAAAMAVDLLLVRPLGLVATVVGTGLFVASLPFSLLGMNTDEAFVRLVGQPAEFTFLRPLGDFETELTTQAYQ